MAKVPSSNRSVITILILILSGEVIFFLPFVIARIFRPTLLEVFQISNFELGTFFSVYGGVAMLSYFFGGPLADRFPTRNLISSALILTGLGGLYMTTLPSVGGMRVLYGFYGFTTIFLFWAALIKATREWGGPSFQGRAFGLLEGGRGLIAALIASASLLLFSNQLKPGALGEVAQQKLAFQWVLGTTALIVIATGILACFMLPSKSNTTVSAQVNPSVVLKWLRKPVIWLQAFIILCAYVGYKITDDISLYANQVLGFDEVWSAGTGTVALWMRPVFALLAGVLADRFKTTRVILLCFILMMLTGLLLLLGWAESVVWLALLLLLFSVVGIYGLRGIYFALMEESGIDVKATGMAVGLVSVVGFLPDVFMSPWMGYLLDTYPGAMGHRKVFLVLTGFALVGGLASWVLNTMNVKNSKASR